MAGRIIATLLAVTLLGVATYAQQAPQTFKAGTEVIAIEVTVLDRSGNPVSDLSAGDFEVAVSGKPRAIQSLQFIQSGAEATPRPAREAETSSNLLPTSGRLLLIVVDESNLRPSSSLAVVRAAERVLVGLPEGDLVGLTRMPDGGGVEFTHDRARIVEGLQAVTGRPPRAKASRVTVSLSEAADYEEHQRFQWPLALRRECGEPTSFGYGLCAAAMQAEAHEMLRDEELKRATFTGMLRRLIETAAAARSPVTMILISESLFLGRDPGALTGIAASAAAARVLLHVVRPLRSAFDAGSSSISSDPAADEDLRRAGLERLAAELRGGFHEVSSTGAAAFDQISRELSGYYLVGIELTTGDRNRRTHPLRVAVRRPGVTVRSRSMLAPPGPSPPTNDVTQQLREMLKSPAPMRALPLKIASHAISDRGRMRLLLSAELGDAIDRESTYHVGLLVIGPTGEAVTSTAGTLRLPPSRTAVRSPAIFTTSLTVEPGDYAVRLAAIAADGRAGSVHHSARARLQPRGGGMSVSTLMVATEPPPNEFPTFLPSVIVDGSRVAARIELTHEDGRLLDTVAVHFEVAGQRFQAMTQPADTIGSRSRKMFGAGMPLELPAGEYEMRAVIALPHAESFVITRPFRFEPR